MLGFSRGLYDYDGFSVVTCVNELYSPRELWFDREGLEKYILDSFDVSYDIVNIYNLNDFELYNSFDLSGDKVDLSELEELVGRYELGSYTKIMVDIDEAYIAQVKVKWEYFGHQYGMVESWWKDSDFQKRVSNGYDQYKSFDNAIEYMEMINGKDKVYILILYKSEGKWYIYNADQLSTMSTQYEKGKATLQIW